MKTIKFKHDSQPAIIQTKQRLLDAMLVRQVPVQMLCGGRGLCATCHVHVVEGSSQLTPQTDREKLTLAVLTGAKANSRLACQAQVLGEGIHVELPKGLYVESFAQLEQLIGKRAQQPVLHPLDARVLIQEGKIITRSVVNELKSVDFDWQKINTRSASEI
ncbi:MAG: (2Fe-2S)-binding protein [Burkholderiales bacterium]|nr:MAG: (2Fe-2S)-binding protein [Burkholderiales bacterium]